MRYRGLTTAALTDACSRTSGCILRNHGGAIVLSLVIAGCGADSRESHAVVVRDSAGIEIVEHRGDLWATANLWSISPEPSVRIGAVEGEAAYLFDGIRGIVVLSDGRIVVANAGDSSLRWYDPNGRFLFQRGGAGEGPGEFSRIGDITLADGDTIVAVDWSGSRFTLFGPDGEPGPTRRITGLTGPPGSMHQLSTGSWVVGISGASTRQLGGRTEPGVYRFDSPILLVAEDGERIDTIGMFPSNEAEIRVSGDRMTFGPAIFGRSLSYAAADDGIIVGTADRLEVDVYAPTGERVRSIRAPDVSVLVTQEVDAAYRENLRQRLASAPAEQRAARERSIAEMTLPDSMPAYSSLLVDDAGNLWVGEYSYDFTPARSFLVFDPEGHFTTTVMVPAGLRVMDVAREHVWGRMTDDLDVQYVAGYAIVK